MSNNSDLPIPRKLCHSCTDVADRAGSCVLIRYNHRGDMCKEGGTLRGEERDEMEWEKNKEERIDAWRHQALLKWIFDVALSPRSLTGF